MYESSPQMLVTVTLLSTSQELQNIQELMYQFSLTLLVQLAEVVTEISKMTKKKRLSKFFMISAAFILAKKKEITIQ